MTDLSPEDVQFLLCRAKSPSGHAVAQGESDDGHDRHQAADRPAPPWPLFWCGRLRSRPSRVRLDPRQRFSLGWDGRWRLVWRQGAALGNMVYPGIWSPYYSKGPPRSMLAGGKPRLLKRSVQSTSRAESNAACRSFRKSSKDSSPTDRRINPSVIPKRSRAAAS